MAKIVCPECGHKNKSTDMICMKCGYYLGDMGAPSSQSGQISTVPESNTPPQEERAPSTSSTSYTGTGDVIKVQTRGSIFSILPMVISIAILGVIYYLIYELSFPIYYVLPVLVVLFVLPTFTRRLSFPIKFTPSGFSVPKGSSSVEFQYSNIDSAVVEAPMRGIQLVKLSLKENSVVTLDFDQMMSMRQFLMQLQRRRIPISIQRQQPSNGMI